MGHASTGAMKESPAPMTRVALVLAPILALILAPILALILAAVQPATAQSLQKLHVTIPTPSIVMFPLYWAQDQGLFARQGLDVEIVSTNGDGPDVDALIAGSVEFTISTPNRLFTSFEQGKPLLAVMAMVTRMAIECAMNKTTADSLHITPDTPLDARLRAMKGLTVGATRPGAFTYLLLQSYARRVGLVPQKDVQIVGVGATASMLPALENGQIAVGCTGSPFTELAQSRGKAIRMTSNMSGADPAFNDFLYELVYVRPDYAQKNPDTVRRFLAALVEAVATTVDTPVEGQMAQLHKRFGGVSDALLAETLTNVKPAFNRGGTLSPTAVDKAAAFLLDVGAIKVAAPFDRVTTNEYLPRPAAKP